MDFHELVHQLRLKLEGRDGVTSEPSLEHLWEVERAFEKVIARMAFLSCWVSDFALDSSQDFNA